MKRPRQPVLKLLLATLAIVSLAACTAHPDPHRRRGGDDDRGADKVTVCHKGKKTLHIALPALEAHLNHGDYRGPCR